MLKQMRGLLLILLLLCVNSITISEIKAETGTVPLSIAVNGSLVVSDGELKELREMLVIQALQTLMCWLTLQNQPVQVQMQMLVLW